MLPANFSIYDFMVNGFKMTFGRVRLFIMTILTMLGLLVATMFGMLIIISPTLFKIWHMLPSIKQIVTNAVMQDGAGVLKGGMGMLHGGMQMVTGIFTGGAGIVGLANTKATVVATFIEKVKASLTTLDYALFILAWVFFLVIMMGLMIGFMRIVLDVVSTGDSTVSRILSCFNYIPRFFVASLISMVLISVGLALLVVPGIILILRLRFFPYYMIDKNMGAIASLKASFHATKGMVWELLGLNIIAAVIATFIPVFGAAIACCMVAGAYRVLPR